MLHARFLQPRKVFEMDTLDMEKTSSSENLYLLLVVYRARKFASAYPLRTKDVESVATRFLMSVYNLHP